MFTKADEIIETLAQYRRDLIKYYYEWFGEDMIIGDIDEIEYQNYLIDNPIQLNDPNGDPYGMDSEFTGAGAGTLQRPPGFYSDQVLYEFITRAEGKIGLRWVTTYKGNQIATRCGINGWDFAGGVHSPAIARAIGVSASDFESWVTIDKNSGLSRMAMGEELKEGAAWGWATSPLNADNPYWQKLIPYYRDRMIWAWSQPIIQAVREPAERLARMHSINWWGYHYIMGFSGGSGWGHRYQAAKEACGNMPNFY